THTGVRPATAQRRRRGPSLRHTQAPALTQPPDTQALRVSPNAEGESHTRRAPATAPRRRRDSYQRAVCVSPPPKARVIPACGLRQPNAEGESNNQALRKRQPSAVKTCGRFPRGWIEAGGGRGGPLAFRRSASGNLPRPEPPRKLLDFD